jgi:hypothetical protein
LTCGVRLSFVNHLIYESCSLLFLSGPSAAVALPTADLINIGSYIGALRHLLARKCPDFSTLHEKTPKTRRLQPLDWLKHVAYSRVPWSRTFTGKENSLYTFNTYIYCHSPVLKMLPTLAFRPTHSSFLRIIMLSRSLTCLPNDCRQQADQITRDPNYSTPYEKVHWRFVQAYIPSKTMTVSHNQCLDEPPFFFSWIDLSNSSSCASSACSCCNRCLFSLTRATSSSNRASSAASFPSSKATCCGGFTSELAGFSQDRGKEGGLRSAGATGFLGTAIGEEAGRNVAHD